MCTYLVGAGPGDEGLLTVKGLELLKKADVIIYDHLVSPALLGLARPECKLIYVGKQAGRHTLPQLEINSLLIKEGLRARENGSEVVRLKGGDPFLFGRGGEEAEALLQAGLQFEVVPGVSSAWAVAAYAGIPLTLRGVSSSVALVTGQPGAGLPSPDWGALAQSADTLVVLMGAARLHEICGQILLAGINPDTPSALIEWGTLGRQRKLTAGLSCIAEKAGAAGFSSPAVLIVGQVAGFGEQPSWFERKPLFGRTIAVTRSMAQAGEFSSLLRSMGAMTIELPCIEIRPITENSPLKSALNKMKDYSWVVFTSANGVNIFWDMLSSMDLDSRLLGAAKVAAIGPGTADALHKRFIKPDFVPDVYVSEALGRELAEQITVKGGAVGPVLIARSRLARTALEDELRLAGVQAETVSLYDTVLPPEEIWAPRADELRTALRADRLDAVTFCSASAVDNFFKLISPEEFADKRVCFACIGPITAERLKKYGPACTVQPDDYSLPALALALGRYLGSGT
ncbi:MAG: uroporphyrinogen-III C-methyltransferase [Desulfovibrionaceae bacterium]|nr:uroporphyrinogen-III C-methyltransferase [Desulfovibrionaceae bacterium]